jgi:hypothetical protein
MAFGFGVGFACTDIPSSIAQRRKVFRMERELRKLNAHRVDVDCSALSGIKLPCVKLSCVKLSGRKLSCVKSRTGRATGTVLLVLFVLLAAVWGSPSRAYASPPPENWGCRTVYPIRIQRDSIFWNYWEYAGAMGSGKIRLWKHYYVVYNHPNWVKQYVHTDSVFCP